MQLIRYAHVGLVGFVVDAGIMSILIYILEIGVYVSRAASFLLAVTITWQLHYSYTYRLNCSCRSWSSWSKYLILNGWGWLLNLSIYGALIEYQVVPLAAVGMSSIVAAFFNYYTATRHVFIKK